MSTTIKLRRHRLLYVQYDALAANLIQNNLRANITFRGVARVEVGLPTSARVVHMFDSQQHAAFCFVFEDESFEECPPGTLAPRMCVEWEVQKPLTALTALSKLAPCQHGCVHACPHTRHFEKVVEGLGVPFEHVPALHEDPAQAKLKLDDSTHEHVAEPFAKVADDYRCVVCGEQPEHPNHTKAKLGLD